MSKKEKTYTKSIKKPGGSKEKVLQWHEFLVFHLSTKLPAATFKQDFGPFQDQSTNLTRENSLRQI